MPNLDVLSFAVLLNHSPNPTQYTFKEEVLVCMIYVYMKFISVGLWRSCVIFEVLPKW
jgi:hypothetical protein